MSAVNTPDIELFRKPPSSGGIPGNGKWQRLIASMEPNVPIAIPAIRRTNDTTYRAFRLAAQQSGRNIVCRTVNNEMWACWVVEGDK